MKTKIESKIKYQGSGIGLGIPYRIINASGPVFPVLLMFALLAGASCKKGSIETNYGPVLLVANNHVMAENAYSRVFNIFYRVVSDSVLLATGERNINGAACQYSDDPVISYTIDYGPGFVTANDMIERKGRIVVVLDTSFRAEGAVAALSFDSYAFIDHPDDTVHMAGDCSISYLGLSGGLRRYRQEVSGGVLSIRDSLQELPLHWDAERTIYMVGGAGTPVDYADDVFTLSGRAGGTAANGVLFSSVITDSLNNYAGCRWIRDGMILLETPGLDIRNGFIQYLGQDECLPRVSYTFNGNLFFDDLMP